MKSRNCEIVLDLLPNYIEKLTSQGTNEFVEEHMQECTDCKTVYEGMKTEIQTEQMPEVKEFGKFLKGIKKKYVHILEVIALAIGMIGVATCFIVDIAMNRALTWSLIVLGSVLMLYVPGYVLLAEKKNRIGKTLAVLSVLILPYLYVMQYVLERSFSIEGAWFQTYACPIVAIWLVFAWMVYVEVRIVKWNVFFHIAFACLLAIPANVQTNIVAGSLSGWNEFGTAFMEVGFGNVAAVLLCVIIGFIYCGKQK